MLHKGKEIASTLENAAGKKRKEIQSFAEDTHFWCKGSMQLRFSIYFRSDDDVKEIKYKGEVQEQRGEKISCGCLSEDEESCHSKSGTRHGLR